MALNRKFSEQRSHPRYNIRLRAMLVSGRRLMHTYCLNLSEGGVLLEGEPKRDFSYPVIHLLIHDRESSVQLLFKVEFVGNSKNRLKFVDLRKEHVGLLNYWIAEHQTESAVEMIDEVPQF